MDQTSGFSADADLFRRVMARFATGVTVVAARWPDGQLHAMTANAFMSGSLAPPLVVISVGRTAQMHACLSQAERFSVSVLRHGQEEASNHFAGRGAANNASFGELAGLPVLDGAIAQIAARKWAVHECGDHDLFVGEVLALRAARGEPLLYYDRHYGGFRRNAEEPPDGVPPIL
jgi:flavin reductase (DIM6/NTAB) family NADH-FMN oxidoreductase RutF